MFFNTVLNFYFSISYTFIQSLLQVLRETLLHSGISYVSMLFKLASSTIVNMCSCINNHCATNPLIFSMLKFPLRAGRIVVPTLESVRGKLICCCLDTAIHFAHLCRCLVNCVVLLVAVILSWDLQWMHSTFFTPLGRSISLNYVHMAEVLALFLLSSGLTFSSLEFSSLCRLLILASSSSAIRIQSSNVGWLVEAELITILENNYQFQW